jgi:hypothetical protein
MATKPPRPWTVTPHGPLEQHDDNLWSIESPVPGIGNFPRRMAIVRRSDGTLVFYNAVPLDDQRLAEVNALGKPRQLVIAHYLHMIDAHAFAEKLGLEVFGPGASLGEIAKRHVKAKPLEDFEADGVVHAESVRGFSTGEAILLVKSGPRTSLVVADVVMNVRKAKGFSGFLFGLMGMTGKGPRLPGPVKMRVCKDKAAVRAQLETWADIPGIARIVPTHGAPWSDDVPGTLRKIAKSV